MTVLEEFEIESAVFETMTGMLAPGKDEPPGGATHTYEERANKYREWFNVYGVCVRTAIRKTENILGGVE